MAEKIKPAFQVPIQAKQMSTIAIVVAAVALIVSVSVLIASRGK